MRTNCPTCGRFMYKSYITWRWVYFCETCYANKKPCQLETEDWKDVKPLIEEILLIGENREEILAAGKAIMNSIKSVKEFEKEVKRIENKKEST